MLRVLLADDHAIMREGLRRLLADEPGLQVVGEAASGDELLALAAGTDADVLLMDLSMPGPGPLETLRRLQRLRPALRVLVLTMHKDASVAARLLHAGAAGFVCKDNAMAMIGMALKRIHAGGRFIDPDLVEGVLAAGRDEASRSPQDALTAREYEILQLVVAGEPLKSIAGRLHISPKTVSTHKSRLMEKLGVESNAALVEYALAHGLGLHGRAEVNAPDRAG